MIHRLLIVAGACLAMAVAASSIRAEDVVAKDVIAGDLHISDVWARPSVTSTGAAYLSISNTGTADDALVGAASTVSASTVIHEMTMTDMVMRMRNLSRLELPSGQSVRLAPGGMHVMLIGLKAPLKAGETFTLSLEFEKAGHVELPVTVAKNAASAVGNMGGMKH